MKLSRIELRDFRQFAGTQTLELSSSPGRGVTLIHAENGVGKTTLLNSVLWAMYAKTTAKFAQSKSIVNFGAVKKGTKNALVRVQFEFNGDLYMVQRMAREGTESTDFQVCQVREGSSKVLSAPDSFLGSVIPREMAPYFFFDGEQAEVFASEARHGEVGKAIRNMLGFDLAKTAIDDLKHVSSEFGRLLDTLPGATEVVALSKRVASLEDEVEKFEKLVESSDGDRNEWEAQVGKIEASLREHSGARELQELRASYESRLRQISAALVDLRTGRVRWVSSFGPALVSRRIRGETLDFVDEQSLKGKIPSPYNEQFVRGLLHDEACVCGRDLQPGSEHWHQVAKLLHTASSAESLGRIVQARSRIGVLKETAERAERELRSLDRQEARLLEERREVEPKLAEVSGKIKAIPHDEIARMEAARAELKQRIRKADSEKGQYSLQLNVARQLLAKTRTDLHQASQKNDQARRVERHITLATAARDRLSREIASYEREAREWIERKINSILSEVARKDYTFTFSQDMAIHLRYADGGIVPRSSGENQLMGLLFTAALTQFATERAADNRALLTPGTVAPLVLDSPLGQLDMRYRESTARFLPAMAEQVILLLSSSQGDPEVLRALEPHVGAEYVLVSPIASNAWRCSMAGRCAVAATASRTAAWRRPSSCVPSQVTRSRSTGLSPTRPWGTGMPTSSASRAQAEGKSAAWPCATRKSKTESVRPSRNEWKEPRSASVVVSATPAEGFWSPEGDSGSRQTAQPFVLRPVSRSLYTASRRSAVSAAARHAAQGVGEDRGAALPSATGTCASGGVAGPADGSGTVPGADERPTNPARAASRPTTSTSAGITERSMLARRCGSSGRSSPFIANEPYSFRMRDGL